MIYRDRGPCCNVAFMMIEKKEYLVIGTVPHNLPPYYVARRLYPKSMRELGGVCFFVFVKGQRVVSCF